MDRREGSCREELYGEEVEADNIRILTSTGVVAVAVHKDPCRPHEAAEGEDENLGHPNFFRRDRKN